MASSRLSKGPVTEVVRKYKLFPLSRPHLYGNSLLKNAWAEIPEVVCCLTGFAASVLILAYVWRKNKHNEHFLVQPYKFNYTIMRADDPRMQELIRKRPAYYNADGSAPPPLSPIIALYEAAKPDQKPVHLP